MKAREYCCCAIPLVNGGVYTTLIEQFVLGVVAGFVSVTTPSIVGAVTPSFAKWIFSVICWAGAALQVLGFLGISREKPNLFKRYVQFNFIALVAAFAVAAAWAIMSATQHSKAMSNCISDFYPSETSEARTLCNIFPWVDVGLMGGLWLVLLIMQTYLHFVLSSYSKAQRTDHKRINSVYDPANPLTSSIPMDDRSPTADPWDSRPSMDAGVTRHNRQLSGASGHQRVLSDASMTGQPYVAGGAGGYSGYGNHNYGASAPTQPSYAYTNEPNPTPNFSSGHHYSDHAGGGIDRPEPYQPHPAEGAFGRKTPRHRTSADQTADPYYRQ